MEANQKLSEPLQQVCQQNLHLLQYLHALPLDTIGIPEYYEKLTRSLKGKKDPNLIYPVSGGVFIHIASNPDDIRDHYIPVEPSLADTHESALDNIEQRLADSVGRRDVNLELGSGLQAAALEQAGEGEAAPARLDLSAYERASGPAARNRDLRVSGETDHRQLLDHRDARAAWWERPGPEVHDV